MTSLIIKQGNLWPPLTAYLHQADGAPVPLDADTVVHFVMVNETNIVVVDSTVDVIDPAAAFVQYVWRRGDTDVPGSYKAEFIVVLPGDNPVTIPNDNVILITITPALPRREEI